MAAHAKEEKRIAIEKGNLLQGKPCITVIGDGGWAKRSYGHGMNSSSGVVSGFVKLFHFNINNYLTAGIYVMT